MDAARAPPAPTNPTEAQVPMLRISLACWDYDRTLPILDGRVPIDGCEIEPHILSPQQLFPQVVQNQAFDVAELSASSYMLQVTRGESAYTAIPVFPSRFFRHNAIYVRSDAGIEAPKDLEGKRIGVPEFQMTAMVWVRGFLQDQYGVDFHKAQYRTGGLNAPGLKERLPLNMPPQMDVQPIAEGQCLNDLLLAGELDAIHAAAEPKAFAAGDPRVRTLFADPVAEEKAYYAQTGSFPIMHVIAVRKSLVEANPWLPANLFHAFVAAKKMAMQRLDEVALGTANRFMLPWFRAELAATRKLMGDDFWRYGMRETAHEMALLCRYSHEQYLSERLLSVEELFDSSTHDLPGN